MAQGDATSSDVPGKYDVVINGKGYMLLQTLEPSLPFRTHRAIYSYSPTFVERQNVSNSYGDNSQDFFLTVRQRDWSLGEQQKYYRVGQDGRYWQGSNIDVSVPGQVKLSAQMPSLGFSGAVRACARDLTGGAGGGAATSAGVLVASSTNLYRVDATGTITDLGAHGLGATPSKFGCCCDASLIYLSTTSAGTTGVRSWNNASFASFSSSGADSIAFVNNTLYGYRQSSSDLVRWDTTGALTSIFTWKGSSGLSGGGAGMFVPVMEPFGGKLLICFPYAQETSELWVYDGTSPVRLAAFPPNFVATDMEILYGIVYVAGNFYKAASSTTWNYRPAVLFYNGDIGLLWEANTYSSGTVSNQANGPGPALGVSDGRLIFTDDTAQNVLAYNPATGGVSTIASYTAGGTDALIGSAGALIVHTRNQTTGYYYPSATLYPTSGYVISSLIDFDSSLTKQFRGVKVEFDAASDGDGGSVDIAYQVDSLSGAWTTLQTAAASGTEYTLSNISGHAIALKITLNKGTSTSGPTLRDYNVRGAPLLQTFRQREYILDLSGIGFKDPVRIADGTFHPLSGHEQAINLNTAITSTVPITVSDRYVNAQTSLSGSTSSASFTAICKPADCEIYDIAEGWDSPTHPGGYIAKITVREV